MLKREKFINGKYVREYYQPASTYVVVGCMRTYRTFEEACAKLEAESEKIKSGPNIGCHKTEPKEALLCPCCGGLGAQFWTEDTEWITCNDCGLSTDVFEVDSGKALEAWNKRFIAE